MPPVGNVLLNTPEQVQERLEKALEIVNTLELDDELRRVAFQLAFTALDKSVPMQAQAAPIPSLDHLIGRRPH